MKNIVIIGCGQGIGFATAKILSENYNVIGISKTQNPKVEQLNIEFHQIDILNGNLDEINFPDVIDGLVYAPGSINLKPFNRLSADDFKNDFEINVMGAVKVIQKLLPNLKKKKVLRLYYSVLSLQSWECLFTPRFLRAKVPLKV